MGKLTFSFALVVCFAIAPALEACMKCGQYFDYQSRDWCWYCEATYCGMFNCDVRQNSTFGDYCDGEDGCFETGTGKFCVFTPSPDPRDTKRTPMPERLDRTWKLAGVRVSHPGRTVVTSRSIPVVIQ